jgi:hypothetical protein
MNKWKEDEIELLETFLEAGYTHAEIARELDRTQQSVSHKSSRLGIKTPIKLRKTHDEYVAELAIKCPTMKVLETYMGDNKKILHECLICEAQYKCIPSDKLQGHACKFCNPIYKINNDIPGITYLVYFSDIDIYKIGVTSKTTRERNSYQNLKYEVILEHHFDTGREALDLERQWLVNVSQYKINTHLLTSGNTETFRL